MKMLQFFTFFLVIVTVFGRSHHSSNGHNSCSKNYNFDYILFAIQWPETFCESQQCIKHKDQWQIHGAWPENNDGSYPQNCCTDHPFDMKLISADLLKRLTASWGTLKAHGSNEEFWQHEYEKHGTCSINSPKLKTQVEYFTNTLELFEKRVKIANWLSAANINPSIDKIYKMTDVHAAIKKGLGHNVQIQCSKSNRHHVQVFSQINLCINKETLEPQDCPAAAHDRGCNDETIAYLPSSK